MAFRVDVEQIEGAPSWLVNEPSVRPRLARRSHRRMAGRTCCARLLEERFDLLVRRIADL
jgi:hypothetical protein